MYEKAEEMLARILEITKTLPQDHQLKGFEILLSGYVQSELHKVAPPSKAAPTTEPPSIAASADIPKEVLQRFGATAKRLQVDQEKLMSLFDFTTDPFALQALSIPGDNIADKARNVALVIAAKNYFTNGNWFADWKEVKAESVNQNCYDSPNHAKYLKAGGTQFKSVNPGVGIEPNADGIKAAEQLIKGLAEA